jgi:haloalkane dehalogenase
MAVESRRNLTPAARAGYLAPYYDWASRVAVDRFVKDIPMTESHPSRAALETVERSLGRWRDTPMMLMWGLRDWCFSVEFLAEFVRRFPNAQTVTFEHAGHYLFEDEKGQYVAHIERFLNGLSR